MADRFDVLLGILLDKAAQQDVERGLSSIEQGVTKLDKTTTKAGVSIGSAWDEMGNDFEKFNKLFNERYKIIDGNLTDLATGGKVSASSLRKFSKINLNRPAKDLQTVAANNAKIAKETAIAVAEEEKLAKKIKDVGRLGKLTEEQVRDLPETIFQAGVEAADLERKFAATRTEVARLNQAAYGLQRLSTILSVAGVAIIGGITASASQYVKFIEDSGIQGDETAERWIAASKRVKNAQLNLGQASAEVLLPIYEKAAELAEKAAAFVQENPDLVQAALNTGLVVATLGAVGIAVSKGIKIYADFQYLAANALFGRKVDEFVTGVAAFNSGSAVRGGSAGTAGAAGTGRVGSVIGAGLLVAAGVAIAKAVVDAVSQGLAQTDFGKQIDEAQRKAAEGGGGYPGINRYARETEKADQAAEGAAQSTSDLSSNLRDFNQEATNAQATQAFIQYRQQEQQAEEQYMAQRAQVVEQGAQRIEQIEANYAQQRTRLIEQFAATSAQAVSNFRFQQKQAAEQFANSEAQAVHDFNQQQADAREEFQRNEERSRQDHLREMRKLDEDHQDKVRDLVASRDALGLVRENRDYERKKRDAEQEYRIDQQRRRQDFQRQQHDREQEFQQERLRRRQEFQFRQKQAEEQFARQQKQAREQYEQRLKELEEQHRAEVAQAKRQNAEKLRELELQYRQEQVTRRNAFYDILRDLDANLLNEENLRNQYYARMQQDLVKFLESTSSAGSNLPGYRETHQAGGYGPGYTGPGEYVLNRESTRFMEGMIGGRLTQQAMRTSISRGASMNVNASFPGGIISMKMIADELDRRDSRLIRDMIEGLA